ncbi:MAG: META domain-containing protein [Ignavibacteria bacterium]|nr:META domain-containing protein [Ignavibacteria bacterium]
MLKLSLILFFLSVHFTSNLSAQEVSLTGKKWMLAELSNGVVSESSDKMQTPFLIFSEDGNFTGNASCNSISGSYSFDGTYKLKITAAATRMMCDNMETETAFIKALKKTNNIILKDNILMLQSGKMLLAKLEGNSLETPLTNTNWELYELVGKPVGTGSNGAAYTINFSDDKKVSAKFCNSLGGRFKRNNDNAMKINIEISTMMACPEMEMELIFKDALGLVGQYSIENNTDLILHNGKVVLARFRVSDK